MESLTYAAEVTRERVVSIEVGAYLCTSSWMNDEIELVEGSDNPFRDVDIAHADTELMKADLAAEIVRILREREFTGVEAAKLTGVQAADISRIRKADLDRFTIDRLARILQRLDQRIHLRIEISPSVHDARARIEWVEPSETHQPA